MLAKNLNRLSWFLLLLYIFLIKSAYTDADIFAERVVRQNKFSAITLDFSTRITFNDNKIINLFHSLGFMPGGFDLAAVKIKNDSLNDFNYYIKTIKVSGDEVFCQSLQLEVFNNLRRPIYQGPLLDLIINSKLTDSQLENLIFFISFNDYDQELINKRCEFDFEFRTYWQNIDESGGIYAQRKVNNLITSGYW
jgi:hypothetical protein